MIYAMIFNAPPFCNPSEESDSRAGDKKIYELILGGFIPKVQKGWGPFFPEAKPVSDECRDFIAKCLESDPENRMTNDEALKHRWLPAESAMPEMDRRRLEALEPVVVRSSTTLSLPFVCLCVAATAILAASCYLLAKFLKRRKAPVPETDANDG